MIIRGIDDNGDWQFGKGISSYKTNSDAIKQNIKTKILEWQNDCFFNLTAGVDWQNRLEVGQEQLLVLEIKSILLKCQGVVEILNFDVQFDRNLRKITVQYSITTIFSQSVQDLFELPIVA